MRMVIKNMLDEIKNDTFSQSTCEEQVGLLYTILQDPDVFKRAKLLIKNPEGESLYDIPEKCHGNLKATAIWLLDNIGINMYTAIDSVFMQFNRNGRCIIGVIEE